MPIEYSFFDDDLVVVRVEGAPGYDAVVANLRSLWREPRFRAGTGQLLDLRDVSSFSLTRSDFLDLLAQAEKNPAAMTGGPISIVASQDLVFGMMRMYEQLASHLPSSLFVSRDFDEAITWVREIANVSETMP